MPARQTEPTWIRPMGTGATYDVPQWYIVPYGGRGAGGDPHRNYRIQLYAMHACCKQASVCVSVV
eukprot:624908-Prymnesium_polylepis.3